MKSKNHIWEITGYCNPRKRFDALWRIYLFKMVKNLTEFKLCGLKTSKENPQQVITTLDQLLNMYQISCFTIKIYAYTQNEKGWNTIVIKLICYLNTHWPKLHFCSSCHSAFNIVRYHYMYYQNYIQEQKTVGSPLTHPRDVCCVYLGILSESLGWWWPAAW